MGNQFIWVWRTQKLVEDWNSKISYGLHAIQERWGVRTRWLARVDVI